MDWALLVANLVQMENWFIFCPYATPPPAPSSWSPPPLWLDLIFSSYWCFFSSSFSSFSSPSTLFHFFFSPYSLSNPPSPFNPPFIYWWVFVTKIVFMKDRVSVCKCTEILVLNWSSLLFVLKDLSLCLVKNSQRQRVGGGDFEIQGTSHLYNSLFNIHF